MNNNSNNSASPKPKEWTFTTSLALTDAKSEPIVTSSGDTTTSISWRLTCDMKAYLLLRSIFSHQDP